jgi:spore maturation protein CgeB
MENFKIVAVGPLWRGSNAGGLFRALSRLGCLIEVVDEFYHISLQTKDLKLKVLERLLWPLQIKEYNKVICNKVNLFKPQVLFVYKGAFVTPETLQYAKKAGCRLVMFFPDVSTKAHGSYLPKAIPNYELIFTTKTFQIKDLRELYGVTEVHFVPHGFDPEIHRPLPLSQEDRRPFECDMSFIGTWSPKKEKWLSELHAALPQYSLKIWGEQWFKAETPNIKECIQGTAVLGDLYSVALQCSKINLGILSEQRIGSSSGDLITSRTFHITGASGFMLHERNAESLLYYKEEEESGFFEGPEEMIAQAKRFLENPELRERVRLGGYHRALADHSLDSRARQVLGTMSTVLNKSIK